MLLAAAPLAAQEGTPAERPRPVRTLTFRGYVRDLAAQGGHLSALIAKQDSTYSSTKGPQLLGVERLDMDKGTSLGVVELPLSEKGSLHLASGGQHVLQLDTTYQVAQTFMTALRFSVAEGKPQGHWSWKIPSFKTPRMVCLSADARWAVVNLEDNTSGLNLLDMQTSQASHLLTQIPVLRARSLPLLAFSGGQLVIVSEIVQDKERWSTDKVHTYHVGTWTPGGAGYREIAPPDLDRCPREVTFSCAGGRLVALDAARTRAQIISLPDLQARSLALPASGAEEKETQTPFLSLEGKVLVLRGSQGTTAVSLETGARLWTVKTRSEARYAENLQFLDEGLRAVEAPRSYPPTKDVKVLDFEAMGRLDKLEADERLAQEAREKEEQEREAKREAARLKEQEKKIAKYPKAIQQLIRQGRVRMGMTAAQVRLSWGEPDAINRSSGSWGVHEQWVYGTDIQRQYLYFENGRLTSVQN